MTFVERHGLSSPERTAVAADLARRILSGEIDTVRLAFPDQHGVLRGKTLLPEAAAAALGAGCAITTTLFAKDTSHRTVFPVFTPGGGFGIPEMGGAADAVMVPDPATFRLLPWSPRTGWLLCDVHLADGRPVPFATREICRGAVAALAERGMELLAGLEIEFHVFRLEDARLRPGDSGQPGEPPAVSLLSHGYQYLTEERYDRMEPVLDLLRADVLALGLPLRSIEVEYGPSQCEFTFAPLPGLAAADAAVLFRSAVKQICRRHGYHATFMCRPRIPNVMSSGWHLHQSVRRLSDGANAFADPAEPLSALGRGWLGGLLRHAPAGSAFAAPTLNAYRRYRAYSLAPDRAIWGRDNRGVLVRALGGPGDPATRLENRAGEPAANPYLYVASQIRAGLDGVDEALDPGPPADTPYETAAPPLPRSLEEAIGLLDSDPFFRRAFGEGFIDYYVHLKRAEIARFQAEVTDWEQREYFDAF